LRYADIGRYANNGAPVPCSRPHTTYTFAVKQLPSDIAFDGVTIDNDAVQRTAADLCEDEFAAFIGGSAEAQALSRFSVTYFVPDQRGFDLGARWVRCDVIALEREMVLATLPADVEHILDDESILDEYGLCSKGAPDSAAFALLMCRVEHDFRAVEAIRLGAAGAEYPGTQVAGQGGRDRCEDVISDLLGTAGGFTFGWTYPSADDWSDGQRFGYCWLETSD
jgi:hypothetical protein